MSLATAQIICPSAATVLPMYDSVRNWFGKWRSILGLLFRSINQIGSDNRNMWNDNHISHYIQYKHINTTIKQLSLCLELTIIKWELSHIPNLTVMIMYCFHNNNPIHFTIIKNLQMINLKFAFRSMNNHSSFDRSDWSFSRIAWPLMYSMQTLVSLEGVFKYQGSHSNPQIKFKEFSRTFPGKKMLL